MAQNINDRSNKISTSVLSFLLLLSLSFFVTGVYFVVTSSSGEREAGVVIYGQSVADWSSRWRSEFQSWTFLIDGTPLLPVTTGDALHDAGSDLELYDKLRYELNNVVFEQNYNWTGRNVTFTVSTTHNETAVGEISSTVQMLRVTRHRAAAAKTCVYEFGGVWSREGCLQYQRAVAICLVFDPDSDDNGRWVEPIRGCYKGGSLVNYRAISDRIALADQGVNFTDTALIVRSRHDPYLTAKELTHNALNFGMNSSDKITLGGAFLFISLLSCALPFFHLLNRCRCCSPDSDSQVNNLTDFRTSDMNIEQDESEIALALGKYRPESESSSDNDADENDRIAMRF